MKHALAIVAALPGLFAQSADRPRFDVASIKPSGEQRMMYVRPMPGGRLIASAPLRLIVMNAYGMQYSQIVGAPDWLSSERFSIDAKAEGNPTREQVMLMLQTLLEERFQLKAHRESRELPIYALVAAKNGPKLPAPKEGACASPDASGRPDSTLPPCGQVRISMSPAGVVMEGGRAPMSELARVLAIPLDRPVVNRTGLAGLFDIHLQFTDDGHGATPPADAVNPSIFTALQEQLGLKLESTKGPIDVLVIDRVARPTAN
jgi:uncharacterized protein (TIGR03435 family)